MSGKSSNFALANVKHLKRIYTNMKRILFFLAAVCLSAAASSKTLIVYYSYTGDCEAIVTELTRQISADVVEIEPAEKGFRYEANGYALGTQLLNAIKAAPNDAASYPAIDPVNVSLSEYSTVIIVTPLWWSQMAAIMQSYLFQVGDQLAGKQLGLIVSSASSSISGVVADCKRLVPDAEYLSENLWINNSNRANTAALVAEWVENTELNQTENTMQINVIVGAKTFTATLADNETGRAFAQLLPLTLSMTELNGNEKYHYLDSSLPTDSYQPGTIKAGDLMLYGNNCLVLFYKTFSSSYSYSRIGSINDPSGLAEAVGSGNVSVQFEIASNTTGLTYQTLKNKDKGRLIFHNGHVYISRDDNTYTLTGAKIR